MKDEFAWVIEQQNPAPSPLLYWDGAEWTKNSLRAVRFSRQVDADRIMLTIEPAMRSPHMKTAEHGWMADRE